MRNYYIIIGIFLMSFCSLLQGKNYSSMLDKIAVRQVVTDITAWQIRAYPNMDKKRFWKSNGDLSWENGVFLSALAEWAEFDQNEMFIQWYEEIAKHNRYQLSDGFNRIYYADDLAVALMYAKLYMKKQEDHMIHSTMARLEFIMNNPSYAGLYANSPKSKDRWSWCDALFMAPPVFARFANITGNPRLRDFMDREYWTTYQFLFDKEEKLFYRDSYYFDKKEKNGRKVFWGRGNAWVVGGLAQLINELPKDYITRDRYIELFKQMMARLVSFQDSKGYWHASLLDPESYPSPETSSTGFYTFALWWGINNGFLDEKTYLTYARKGWEALVNAVHSDGMLGWVQPVGADPQKVTKDMTEVYGPAAVMLTGKEILLYLKKKDMQTSVSSMNPFGVKMQKRIEEISRMLPQQPTGFGPTYKDRVAWSRVAQEIDTQTIFNQVHKIIHSDMPKWKDESYLEFSRNGVRPPGERMINARKGRLSWLVWAECIENKGTYVPAIESTLKELVSHRSWVLPAHDRKLDNFYGRCYHVDLVSSLFAQDLGQTLYMLDDKLSEDTRKIVIDSVYSRVFNPVKHSLETGNNENTWLYRTDNWNSVCLNGVTGAALFMIPNKEERAYFVAAAEVYSKNSINGFTDDGYCTEGLGYFNYGFQNYIVLREELYRNTGGEIDLFRDSKVKAIARYGIEAVIQNRVYPAFADCRVNTEVDPYILWYCNRNLNLGLDRNLDKGEWSGLTARAMSIFSNTASEAVSGEKEQIYSLPLRTYFDEAGILISRHFSSKGTLSVALKGGNNAENHNHNDLGTFIIVKGNEMLIGDGGGPYHYAGDMWTEKRYTFKTLSSYGHPVPLLDDKCQMSGKEAKARVLKQNFSIDQDEFTLDLCSAYPNEGLEEMTRQFIYNRSENGMLLVEDRFAFAQPGYFESALITFGKWKLVNKKCLMIEGKNEKIEIQIVPPEGCSFNVSSEKLQENGPEMTRIAIRLDQKITQGTVKMIIR